MQEPSLEFIWFQINKTGTGSLLVLLIKYKQFALIMNFLRCVIKEIKHNADTQRIQYELEILKNSNNESIIKYRNIFF